MKSLIITLTRFVTFVSISAFIGISQTDESISLKFVDHITAGMIEQDVFVQKDKSSDKVYRITPEEADRFRHQKVWASKEPHHHDPLNKENIGPFITGKALGMTLGEWLGGRGTATYSCEDGWGNLTASFESLVPNSTYTMWHFFMAMPPTEPFTGTLDLPVGERDGSQSMFKTDGEGNADYSARFQSCLQMGGDQLGSGLAIAWHSDGQTYGVEPGDFGKVSHVQLFAMLPNQNDLTASR